MADLVILPGVKGQFAAGLSWRHADSKPTSKQLREIALEEGRWGMKRTTAAGHHQVGTCDAVDGVKSPKGIRPLAAIVADHHQEPWMGLFPLEGGRYWYIAVRDGGEVIPGGDLIGTMDELMKVRDEHARLGQWSEVNGTLDDLVDMVRSTQKQRTLKDLTLRPWVPVAWSASLLSIVGAGLFGYLYLQNRQVEEARQAQLERERAVAAARKAKADADAHVLPWTREPMVQASLNACREAWSSQPLAQGGWALAGWHCMISQQGITINADWSRDGGVAADAPGTPGADANTSSQSRQIAVAFGTPSPLAKPDDEATRAIWTLAQTNGLNLKLNVPNAKPVLPGAADEKRTMSNVWDANHADFTLIAPPWMNGLDVQLDALPGLRIKTIDWTMKSQRWVMGATMYSLHIPAIATVPKHVDPIDIKGPRNQAAGAVAHGLTGAA